MWKFSVKQKKNKMENYISKAIDFLSTEQWWKNNFLPKLQFNQKLRLTENQLWANKQALAAVLFNDDKVL